MSLTSNMHATTGDFDLQDSYQQAAQSAECWHF